MSRIQVESLDCFRRKTAISLQQAGSFCLLTTTKQKYNVTNATYVTLYFLINILYQRIIDMKYLPGGVVWAKGKVTISQIAELLDVSSITVSRAG